MKKSFLLILFLINTLVIITFAQKEREKGIEFYQNGDYKSAIHYLNLVRKEVRKDDGEFWYYLGKAYFKVSDFNESRKAFEKAVKIKPKNAEFYANLAFANFYANRMKQAEKDIQKAIVLDSNNSEAYYIRGLIFLYSENFNGAISDADQSLTLEKCKEDYYRLKINAHLYKFGKERKELLNMIEPLQKSIEALESGIKNCDASFVKNNQTKLDDLKIFHQYFRNYLPDDSNITPIELLKNPSRANYTDQARQSQVQGTIELAIFFSADGKTKKVLALNQLSKGLVEQAITAAQTIEFNPATKNGKPIDVVKTVQYTFTLY